MAVKIAETFPPELKSTVDSMYGKPLSAPTEESIKGYAGNTSHHLIEMLDQCSDIHLVNGDSFSISNHVNLPSGGAYKYNLTIDKLDSPFSKPDKEVQK
jgi:hypothetical protein